MKGIQGVTEARFYDTGIFEKDKNALSSPYQILSLCDNSTTSVTKVKFYRCVLSKCGSFENKVSVCCPCTCSSKTELP